MSAHQTTTRARHHELNVRMLRFRHAPEREEPALLARELLAIGRHADALELTEIALQREPGDVDLELVRAQALLAAGDAHRGEESLIRVAKSAPQWAAPLSALTRLLSGRGDDVRALRLALKARTLGADDTMVGRLASREEATRRMDARIAAFRADDGTEEPVMLARALELEGRKTDAESILRLALARDPDDADTVAALARVERTEGHTDEAVALYRKARALAPGWDVVERALFSLVGEEIVLDLDEPRAPTSVGEPSVVVDDGLYAEARAMDLDAELDALIAPDRTATAAADAAPLRADATQPYAFSRDTATGAAATEITLVGAPAVARTMAPKPSSRALDLEMKAPPPRRIASGFPTRPVKRSAVAAPIGYVRVLAGDARRHVG
jgi:tetratricopeptide (TPR) repeat protein